jgi:hypothetical protein
MTPFIEEQQIEELIYGDFVDSLVEDPTILDEEDLYDDASFGDFLNSGNDF